MGKVGFSGYKDFAKNPNRSRDAERAFRADGEEFLRLSRRPAAELTEQLLQGREPGAAKKALKAQGAAAIPVLLDALNRPEFRRLYPDDVRESTHVMELAYKPVEHVLDCLEALPDPAFVPLVAPLMSDDHKWTRKSAAHLLGKIGTDECIEPLRKAIDDDDFVRTFALQSIAESAAAGRLSERFIDEAYAMIRPHLVDRHGQTSNEPPASVLFALKPGRAAADVLDPAVLTLENRGLQAALAARRKHGVRVPHQLLYAILASAETAPDTYPNQYIIEQVLKTLVLHPTPAVREAVMRNLRSPSKDVRDYAAAALCTLEGLNDPWKTAFAYAPRAKFANAPEPVRHAILIRYLIDQVNNGGFSQYFVNGYGKEWRRTLAALQAVNARHTHALLKASAEKFGQGGPSLNRYDQDVAELHQRQDDAWNAEDAAFFKDEDGREALVLQYMLANRQHFQ